MILFGPGGWFAPFFQQRGIQIIFALPSMVLVTIFICIPFTIREVVPVLEEIGLDEEDAARTLGASVWHTFFRVTLPNIRWALAYGVALTTARAIGEIGAVLIVSGLLQGKTETATLFIFRAYEERQTPEAYVVALVLASVSVAALASRSSSFRHRRRTGKDPRMSTPIVVEGLSKRFGSFDAVDRRHVHRARGGRDRAARAVGIGQEHRAAHDRRSRGADRRPDLAWATRSSRSRACRSAGSGSCSSTTRCSGT